MRPWQAASGSGAAGAPACGRRSCCGVEGVLPLLHRPDPQPGRPRDLKTLVDQGQVFSNTGMHQRSHPGPSRSRLFRQHACPVVVVARKPNSCAGVLCPSHVPGKPVGTRPGPGCVAGGRFIIQCCMYVAIAACPWQYFVWMAGPLVAYDWDLCV